MVGYPLAPADFVWDIMNETKACERSVKNVLPAKFCNPCSACMSRNSSMAFISQIHPSFPLPPNSEQQHITADYSVSYRYNNYSLRGRDYTPSLHLRCPIPGWFFFSSAREWRKGKHLLIFYRTGASMFWTLRNSDQPDRYFSQTTYSSKPSPQGQAVCSSDFVWEWFQDIGDKKKSPGCSELHLSFRSFYVMKDQFFLKLERYAIRSGKKWVSI